MREALDAAGVSGEEVQQVSDPELGDNVFQIQARELGPSQVAKAQKALESRIRDRPKTASTAPASARPSAQQVADSALKALIFSLLVICAYVAFRFDPKFAVPVLIALFHDILITAGVYSLTGREVTSGTVAAFLTILGYSLYDTIIVFDRIRENMPRMPRAAFSQIVNRSMSEVLTRSLATSFTTLLAVVSLLIFGGATLQDFAFAMLVGIISGTYSSIFIASPVLTAWKEREPGFARRRARIAEVDGTVPAFADEVALAKLSDDSESEAEIEDELAAVAVADPPTGNGGDPVPAEEIASGGDRSGDGGAPRAQRAPPRAPQTTPQAREESLAMALLVWFTMGIALWHFTVFLPDRFWQGIVGAFLGSVIGAIVFGAIVEIASRPRPRHDRPRHRADRDPGRRDRPRGCLGDRRPLGAGGDLASLGCILRMSPRPLPPLPLIA